MPLTLLALKPLLIELGLESRECETLSSPKASFPERLLPDLVLNITSNGLVVL